MNANKQLTLVANEKSSPCQGVAQIPSHFNSQMVKWHTIIQFWCHCIAKTTKTEAFGPKSSKMYTTRHVATLLKNWWGKNIYFPYLCPSCAHIYLYICRWINIQLLSGVRTPAFQLFFRLVSFHWKSPPIYSDIIARPIYEIRQDLPL